MSDPSQTTSAGDLRHTRGRSLAWLAAAYLAALIGAALTVMALPGRDPLWVALAADAVATAVVFCFSVALDNSSMYDPFWSVAPIPIALYWAMAPGGAQAVPLRQTLVVILVVAWGLRLTANQLARWHGLGDEDYRYVDIRRKAGSFYWPASFVGLHLFPTGWVFLGLLAAWPALSGPGRPLGWLDALGVTVTASAIALEAVSDLQLRRFMSSSRERGAMLDTGVWSWCRHPNYLGEMGFWWGLWILGFAARPGWWTLAGPISITLLFVFISVPMKDRRMLLNHPEWAERMKRIPAFLPIPPTSRTRRASPRR
jgi:steroid 5-alpha reductase family enzyme